MDQLLKLPYQEREEVTLRKYLLESTEPNSQEILVMHQLQRAQFVEATRLNKNVNQQMMMVQSPVCFYFGPNIYLKQGPLDRRSLGPFILTLH